MGRTYPRPLLGLRELFGARPAREVGATMDNRGFREFQISVVFRAPLKFAYAWCTEYTPQDPAITGEDKSFGLQRRIVTRTPRNVVFENLYDHGAGWGWERHTVTLSPPNRWHSDGYGNYHETHLDYQLTELPGDRTRFDMRWRSKPTALSHGSRAADAVVERFVLRLWRLRGRALERDYRRSLRRRRRRR
jgi:hypothetical protein